MERSQIRLAESLRTAKSFLDAHADVVGAVNSTDARAQLDAAVAVIDTDTDEQGTRTRDGRGEVARRHQLEQVLIRKYMTPLAKFARAQLQGAPDYTALTPSAHDLRTERLVQSARSMAQAATPHAAKLVAAKFPADFLQQLRAAADAVRASIDARADHRVRRTGATGRIEAALKSGRNALAVLDSLVSHLILGHEPLEREWRSAKRVARSKASRAEADKQPDASVAGTIRPAEEPKAVATAVPSAATAPVAQEVAA